MKKVVSGGMIGALLRWAGGLRFPTLFFLVAGLFVCNVFIPDVIPFADELLMGLVALLLASLKDRNSNDVALEQEGGKPKD